ncbi:MAG: iron ABC transporter permease [Pseudomonadota bacterium]
MTTLNITPQTGWSPDRKALTVSLTLTAALLAMALASLCFGLTTMPPADIWATLMGDPPDVNSDRILTLRWHRLIVGIGVGICLALSGAILQAILRNPLVEPGVIGLNSGAALAAAFVLVLTTGAISNASLATAAILGATTAVALVTALAWSPGNLQPMRLILAGIAVASLAGALLTAAMLAGSPQRLPRLLVWLSGDLNGVSAKDAHLVWIALAGALPLVAFVARRLDIAMLDPVSGAGLGHRQRIITYALLGLAAALAGIATAVCGIVVFVGLVAPHLARRLTGPMNRRVLPAAALIGALIVSSADLFGRTIDPPTQLPAGLICGLIGAPFFFLLMRRHHG